MQASPPEGDGWPGLLRRLCAGGPCQLSTTPLTVALSKALPPAPELLMFPMSIQDSRRIGAPGLGEVLRPSVRPGAGKDLSVGILE